MDLLHALKHIKRTDLSRGKAMHHRWVPPAVLDAHELWRQNNFGLTLAEYLEIILSGDDTIK